MRSRKPRHFKNLMTVEPEVAGEFHTFKEYIVTVKEQLPKRKKGTFSQLLIPVQVGDSEQRLFDKEKRTVVFNVNTDVRNALNAIMEKHAKEIKSLANSIKLPLKNAKEVIDNIAALQWEITTELEHAITWVLHTESADSQKTLQACHDVALSYNFNIITMADLYNNNPVKAHLFNVVSTVYDQTNPYSTFLEKLRDKLSESIEGNNLNIQMLNYYRILDNDLFKNEIKQILITLLMPTAMAPLARREHQDSTIDKIKKFQNELQRKAKLDEAPIYKRLNSLFTEIVDDLLPGLKKSTVSITVNPIFFTNKETVPTLNHDKTNSQLK